MKCLVILLAVATIGLCQLRSTTRPFENKPFTFSSIFNRPSTARPYQDLNRYRYNSNNVGRYNAGRYNSNNDGRYNPNDDGRYVDDNSGRYVNNDGRYIPDGSGGYVHVDNKYEHLDVGGGKYVGGKDSYTGDTYRGDNNPYIGDNDKYAGDKYKGDNNPYTGDKDRLQGDRYKGDNNPYIGVGGRGQSKDDQTNRGDGKGTSGNFGSSNLGNGNVGRNDKSSSGSGLSGPQYQGSDKCNTDSLKNLKIIKEKSHLGGPDGYEYLFETENCMYKEEEAVISDKGTKDEILRAKGYYHYVGPDKVKYVVTYSSDENGFLPQGEHIPTMPPLIQKGLNYLKSIGKL